MTRLRPALIAVGIAIILVVVLYSLFPTTTVDVARWWQRRSAGFSRHEITTASGTVPYLDGGTGPVVLLLHGFQDQKDTWVDVARHLTDRYRVLMPDLHGFGDNRAPTDGDYRPDAQARRMHDFLAALGVRAAHIGGVSMGGEIAGAFAKAYPGETLSLALFSSAGVRPDTISALGRRILAGDNVFHVTDRVSLDRLVASIADSGMTIPEVAKRAMVAEYRVRNPQWDTVLRELTEPATLYLLDSIAPDIHARTLVLWGLKDPLFPVSGGRRLAARLPGAEFVLLLGCGHLCPATRPGQVAEQYRRFLLQTEARAAASRSARSSVRQ